MCSYHYFNRIFLWWIYYIILMCQYLNLGALASFSDGPPPSPLPPKTPLTPSRIYHCLYPPAPTVDPHTTYNYHWIHYSLPVTSTISILYRISPSLDLHKPSPDFISLQRLVSDSLLHSWLSSVSIPWGMSCSVQSWWAHYYHCLIMYSGRSGFRYSCLWSCLTGWWHSCCPVSPSDAWEPIRGCSLSTPCSKRIKRSTGWCCLLLSSFLFSRASEWGRCLSFPTLHHRHHHHILLSLHHPHLNHLPDNTMINCLPTLVTSSMTTIPSSASAHYASTLPP